MESPVVSDVIGVAGEYLGHGGKLDPKVTRLKTSDREVEGISVELHGGEFRKRKQKAVISFLCEKDWTGNEGVEEDKRRSLSPRDDGEDDGEDDGDDNGGNGNGDRFKQDPKNALQFVSYGEEGEGKERIDVLRLDWRTKYACEEVGDGDDEEPTRKSGWGFFTWIILMYVDQARSDSDAATNRSQSFPWNCSISYFWFMA